MLIAAQVVVAAPERSGTGNETAALAQLGPRLARALAQPMPTEKVAVRVTLRRKDLPGPGAQRRARIRARQQEVLGTIAAGGLQLKHRYQSLSGFSGWVKPAVIEALRRHPAVVSVHLDAPVYAAIAQGVALVGAETAHTQGFTGAGVNVAVLDTGIDADHPDLAGGLLEERCYCDTHPVPGFGGCCPGRAESASGPGSAEDDDGHGTSVTGIIASAGAVSALGVAPDAGIVAIKVLDSSGTGSESDIEAGLDWVLTNHVAKGIRVVNLSVSDGGEYDDASVAPCAGSALTDAIHDLNAAGVAVFAASGNDGHDDGISWPACAAEAISVGGVYDAWLGSVSWCGNASCSEILCTNNPTGADVFVCHTNSGSLLDLLAPDYRTDAPNIGGGTIGFAGTSAAAPYAAGQAALLLQADATLSADTIRALMKGSGPSIANPDSGRSFRRAQVDTVLASLGAQCGNGVLEPGEACDDGNTTGGDCCSAACDLEAAGSACDDEDACTENDTCNGSGDCAGSARVCDDAELCTDDDCDSVSGCVFIANTALCDDGDACTAGDVCANGICTAGAPITCDDAELCTDDTCDAASGCVFTANNAACDDGNACTSGETCADGTCWTGAPLDCDDEDPCTADSCDAIEGCAHDPVAGCTATIQPVPALPGWGVGVLVLGLAGGAFSRGRGRRRRAPGSPARSRPR
jgi:cysteine-rich repeat protein